MSLRLPDFVVAGAPRSATSWLYELLDRHPAIHMAKPVKPEPKFFLVDTLYERGIAYYSETWFADVPQEKMAGEKSTNYLENDWAAQRMAECIPNAKLIFVLRNPVDRAISNYCWSKMNGMEKENFERAMELEEERERNLPASLRYARPHDYYSRGLYAKHLKKFYKFFPKDRILCVLQDDIATNPAAVATEVQLFIGVQARPQDVQGLGTVNASKGDAIDISPATRAALAKRYEKPNEELVQLLGPKFAIWNRSVHV